MTKLNATKKVFKRIEKEYPLLRKSLRAYFVEIIILMFEGMQHDRGYDDMNDTEKLNYSYEINTCDEYHSIIDDFNHNVNDINSYLDLWDFYYIISCSR